jgi:hypothetical protein
MRRVATIALALGGKPPAMSSRTADLGRLVGAGRRVDGRAGSRLRRRAEALLAVRVRRESQIPSGPYGPGAWWSR